ncbi:MAG: hypothetical protein IIC88_08255 [Chloroflexi bacterium]|nr:hypothetical protein [Chloroflexota bacterium]
MRLPTFLARLWSKLTGSMSGYVYEPTPEEEKAMQEAAESTLVDGPEITLTGEFDVNDREEGGSA